MATVDEPNSASAVAQIPLDVDQARAAACSGHGLIIAGPGSGKTRTLSARGINLINRSDDAIAAVSFTRDGAQELRDRIIAAGPRGCQKRVYAGTFHSLALRQLRMAKQAPQRIAAGSERWGYLLQARSDTGLMDIPPDEVESRIDAIKADPAPPPGKTEGVTGALLAAYTQLLNQAGVCDFADLIRIAVQGLKSGRFAPLPVGSMLVDEAQDLDPVQYAWLQYHWEAGVAMTLVGDDDQSIYAWRQAMGAKGMRSFQLATDALEITVATNYRCRPQVLYPAIRLIENETDRFDKPLQPARADGGAVTVREYDERAKEAEAVRAALHAHGRLSECAVIARTNRLLDPIERELTLTGTPYIRAGGSSFWDTKGPAALISLLRSIIDDHPAGVIHALRIIGADLPQSMPQASTASDFLQETAKGTNGAPHNLARMAELLRPRFREWRNQLAKDRMNLVIRGAGRWLGRQLGNWADLIESAANTLAQLRGSLTERLSFIKKRDNNDKESRDAVTLVTCHGSKGREWPWVWIFACEHGTFPHDEAPLREERRLAYVAFTRAGDTLTVSYATAQGQRSLFLIEAGLCS
jgi:superfamily I DNA/RNA helicase